MSGAPQSILIVEDEPLVARRIARFCRAWIAPGEVAIEFEDTVEAAIARLDAAPVDLLLLDLNLHGEDGFSILEQVTSFSAQTIVISAYADQALRAFEHGVLDFVAKPFEAERLGKALARFAAGRRARQDAPAAEAGDQPPAAAMRFLSFRTGRRVSVVALDDVVFARGADRYSEILIETGDTKLHDKSLSQLEAVLPPAFVRVHKSYIVNMDKVAAYQTAPGNRFELVFTSGDRAPVSRSKIREIKALIE